jgi:hypothetical protein
MSNKKIFLSLLGLTIFLGTATFFLKRFLDFDFKAYGTGILFAFIAFVIIKNRRIKKP